MTGITVRESAHIARWLAQAMNPSGTLQPLWIPPTFLDDLNNLAWSHANREPEGYTLDEWRACFGAEHREVPAFKSYTALRLWHSWLRFKWSMQDFGYQLRTFVTTGRWPPSEDAPPF